MGRIQHSFPEGSHFIQGAHPFFGLLSQIHPGQSLSAGGGVSAPEGSHRAGSTSFTGLLQPVICSDEGLSVVATSNRSFSFEPQGVGDTFQDGDSPIHSVVGLQRGLDGLHRSQRCISSDSNTSGILKTFEVHGLREGLPIQGLLLWSVHGSAGLHTGHGSGFGNSSQFWHLSPTLSGRLAEWLIQASSREQVLLALRTVLRLCNSLGIVVNWEKSQLVPTQTICYLGVILGSINFRASPAQKRVDKLLSIGDVFLSSVEQPAKSWLELLGVLSSLTQLIPGGRLRMRSFQFVLHRAWDRVDPDALVRWSPEIYQDLLWWLNHERLEHGISLEQVSPQLGLWSDASDVGWGAHLGDQVVSGRWSHEELLSSINHLELLAMFYVLQHFLPPVRNTSVAVFADNTTALAYLKNQGGTISAVLNQTAQDLLRWTEFHSVMLLPQFIMGRNNVLADALSRPNQILGSEWTLKLSVFQQLRKRWPVAIDLFATSLNHSCLPYFSPFHDPNSIGTYALLQPWDGWQAYVFPPYALIPAVLKKLRSSSGVLLTIIAPYWPQRPWFPELLELVVDGPVALPLDQDLLIQPHAHRQHLGLSRLALHAWRLSSDL